MRAAAVVFLVAVALAAPARAFDDYEGTRALSMGGATRAWAIGDSAVLLNPSGITLTKAYNVEAAYAYGSRVPDEFFHASIVDSTSESGLGGGVYYTYHLDRPSSPLPGHGHELGAALSLPVGNAAAIGGTLKWFRLEGLDAGSGAAVIAPPGSVTGFTGDVGLTARPNPQLSFAVVGVNLVRLGPEQAARLVTYGGAFVPVPEVVLAVDGVTRVGDAVSGTGVRAGIEATLAQRVTLRAGGGTDPVAGAGYLAAGVSALSEVGAVDVGVRGDLFPYRTGSGKDVFVGVSLRLFVPGAVASASAPSP